MASERLNKAIEYLKSNGLIHKQQDIADALGMAKSHLSNALKGGNYFTEGFLKRFAKAYEDYIEENWLLTGEGKMEKINPKSQRMHIPSDKAMVSAGFMGASINSVSEYECDLCPVISAFPWYDFTIEVNGDSMAPTLLNGDVIAGEWLRRGDIIDSNKIYILDTNDGAVVKRIKQTNEGLLCHSDNPTYLDFIVDKNIPMRIARVVGMIRKF